ncbi:MAG: adenylate/guanylate cyclase domain-containing protein [Saprospiraceae bacterium]|nr:adenylate/guanylate cyclase domain-containing protein [Saprospiraceae bacterium]
MPEKEIRQLAAVMFTDIAGYTAMVQEDEAGALKKVARYRQVLQQCTDAYGGKVIAFYGDGSLSIYPSASNAVRCAIDMQAGYREGERVPVRIGLHLGDIVLKDDTVYGDGVNVASRIEAQGVPGAILISGKIQREVKNQADIHTRLLGRYDLKNVQEDIDVYAVVNEGLVIPPKPAAVSKTRQRAKRFGIAAGLLFLVGYFLVNAGILPFFGKGDTVPAQEERVAVWFQDFAQVESLPVSEMAGRLLIDKLREVPNTKVVSYESAQRQARDAKEEKVVLAATNYSSFAARTGAVNLIDGYIVRIAGGDSLEFHASLKSLYDPDEVITTFKPVKCAVSDPVDGISQLISEVLGFWASQDDILFTVPTIEAYRSYLNAKRAWSGDDDLAYRHVRNAIRQDSSFLDPYFQAIQYWLNSPRCNRDSAQYYVDLVRLRFDDMSQRQKNFLNYYREVINGNKTTALAYYQNEVAVDPLDHHVNTGGMVLANTLAHDARKTIEYYELIPFDSLDFDQCTYCRERIEHAIDAYLQTGDVNSARRIADNIVPDHAINFRSQIQVYAQVEDTAALNSVARAALSYKRPDMSAWSVYFQIARRFRLLGNDDLSLHYARIAESQLKDPGSWAAMETYYLKRQYQDALPIISTYLKTHANNPLTQLYAGVIHANLGNTSAARQAIAAMQDTKTDCGEGEKLYYQATIFAQLGEEDAAIAKLKDALNSTIGFEYWAFENDPNMMPLRDNPAYQRLVYPLEAVQQ